MINLKTTENSIKLLTKGKYCDDDINVTFEGGSGVVEVDELPTNPQENVIYQVNKISDIDVYVFPYGYNIQTLEEILVGIALTPNLTYYLVESLPSTPSVSDLQTFNPAHIYICEDIPYLYGNAGYGNMWLPVVDLYNSMSQETPLEIKGYVESVSRIYEHGLYVTYKLGKQCIAKKENYGLLVNDNNVNIDYEQIFFKTIKEYYNPNLYVVPNNAFAGCSNLKKVNLPNVTQIWGRAFSDCPQLKDLYLGGTEVVYIYNREVFAFTYTTVHVRPELLSAYQSDEKWAECVNNGNVTLVGDYTD